MKVIIWRVNQKNQVIQWDTKEKKIAKKAGEYAIKVSGMLLMSCIIIPPVMTSGSVIPCTAAVAAAPAALEGFMSIMKLFIFGAVSVTIANLTGNGKLAMMLTMIIGFLVLQDLLSIGANMIDVIRRIFNA